MKDNFIQEIRFAGYSEPWKQRKLKEIADFSKGSGYSKSDLTHKGDPIILYGRLYTKYETLIRSVDTFTVKKEKSVMSKGHEVIVPSSGETSEDISRAAVVKEPGIILGGDLNVIRPMKEIDSIFLALSISNGKQRKELIKRAQGKSVVHLHNSDLKEVDLLFPGREEQTKIGEFFTQLDETIALHQQELETLKKTKQGFLQKMFPKERESVPEIRFSGFTGGWDNLKLGEAGKVKSGIGFPESEQGGQKGIPFFKVSDMNNIGNESEMLNSNHYISPEQVQKNKWKPIEEVPAVIFAKVGAALLLNRKRLVTTPCLIDNNLMAFSFSEMWDVNFGYTLFQTLFFPKYAQIGALPSFNASDINSIEIKMPNIDEQRKIGNFFKKLDEIIALHQQELDALKQTKKAFLQKMFV